MKIDNMSLTDIKTDLEKRQKQLADITKTVETAERVIDVCDANLRGIRWERLPAVIG